MVIMAAIASMLAVVVMGYLLTRFGPSRVIPSAFALSASLFVANWWLYPRAPALTAVLLYGQMAVFGAVLISGFWSVINERFDPYSAKQTVARVAAAATLGGVLGGLLADRVATLMDVRAMLIVLALLHLGCALTVAGIGRTRHTAVGLEEFNIYSGVQILLKTRYLLLMGLLMTLIAALAALVDYAFKAEASTHLTDSDSLVVFFARFYAVIGVATFIVQSSLGPGALRKYGIGATLAVLPGVVLCAGILNMFVPRLWAVVALRASQVSLQNSLFRSGFELLYTPLAPAKKRPTKSLIDVASDRLGDMLGGGLLLALLAAIPSLPPFVVVLTSVVLAVIALVVIVHLYRGYVEQLAMSLRDGSISLSKDEVVDATTRHTLAEVSAAAEREQLMARIKARKRAHLGIAEQTAEAPKSSALSALPGSREEKLPRAVADLTSGDAQRVRDCLLGDFMDARLVPFMIPLLGVEALAEDARMELRWLVPHSIGVLNDALLNPDLPLLVRQRIPGVLEVSHNPRVVQALLSGLDDTEFNVRYSCARALARMRRRDAELSLSEVTIYQVVRREVEVDSVSWSRRELVTAVDLPVDLAAAPIEPASHANYSLEHVFNLLSLVLDPDALYLSLQAVFSKDRTLRGTALEYLENVLPDDIRAGLWPHLGQTVPKPGPHRGVGELVEELRRSTATQRIGSKPV